MLFSFAWLRVSFGLSWEVSFKSSSLSLFTPQLPVGILLSKVSKIYKKYAFFPSPYFHTSLKAGCTSLSSTTCFGTRRIWENNGGRCPMTKVIEPKCSQDVICTFFSFVYSAHWWWNKSFFSASITWTSTILMREAFPAWISFHWLSLDCIRNW